MALTKVTYENGVTTIGAANLNAIQDEIIANAASISSIESTTATTSAAGLMSAADKTKLDGIAAGATAVTIDNTLTQSGQAADAKVTGDDITLCVNDGEVLNLDDYGTPNYGVNSSKEFRKSGTTYRSKRIPRDPSWHTFTCSSDAETSNALVVSFFKTNPPETADVVNGADATPYLSTEIPNAVVRIGATLTSVIPDDCTYIMVMYRTSSSSKLPTGMSAHYYASAQAFIAQSLIAPVLDNFIADTNLSVNDFRVIDGKLYIITANIAQGDAITVGTNATATTVGEQITALLNA